MDLVAPADLVDLVDLVDDAGLVAFRIVSDQTALNEQEGCRSLDTIRLARFLRVGYEKPSI